jgi:hypothetical protein
MDIDLYTYARIKEIKANKIGKRAKAEIEGLANNFNVSGLKQLVDALPLKWIDASIEHTSNSKALIRYCTEEGMIILRKLHYGKELTETEQTLLKEINADLKTTPVTDKEFMVFRGLIKSPDQVVPGAIIKSNGPSSATFSFEIALDYVGIGCCIAEILIPKGSNVTYVDMLDQLIFPPQSSFKILTKPAIKKWYAEEQTTYQDFLTFKCEFIKP